MQNVIPLTFALLRNTAVIGEEKNRILQIACSCFVSNSYIEKMKGVLVINKTYVEPVIAIFNFHRN